MPSTPRKWFLIIFLVLFLVGCTKSESVFDSSLSEQTKPETDVKKIRDKFAAIDLPDCAGYTLYDYCVIDYVKKQQNPRPCEHLRDSYSVALCLTNVAVALQDEKICILHPNSTLRAICTNNVTQNVEACGKIDDARARDLCYSEIAKNTQNAQICDKLGDSNTVDACYLSYVDSTKDLTGCERIQDKGTQKRCLRLKERPLWYNPEEAERIHIMREGIMFDTLRQGAASAYKQRQNFVITNSNEWENFWANYKTANSQSKPYDIDFSQYMIIAVFGGPVPTTGYNIEITKIVESDDRLEVFVKDIHPGHNCKEVQTVLHPHHIVKVPKRNKEVVFNIEQAEESCN